MRLALTPCWARYPLTAVARRAPSAMLYSRVPRSSAWPSMVTVYCVGRPGPVRSSSRDSRLTSAPRSQRPSGRCAPSTCGRTGAGDV